MPAPFSTKGGKTMKFLLATATAALMALSIGSAERLGETK